MKQSVIPSLLEEQISQKRATHDVNRFLETYFATNAARSGQLHANYEQLWSVMSAQSMAGGKRIRPYLVVLAYTAYGGQNYPAMIPVAAAQELLHMSLLVHDDIIDNDYARHGRANVAGAMRSIYEKEATEDANHHANSAALLAGDLLLSGAYQVIIASPLTDHEKLVALTNLSDAIFAVGGGELLDSQSSFRPIIEADSLAIAELKTARYSFVSPLTCGAKLAGADQVQQQALETFGTALGVAFQLVDDLLGIFGDPEVTGKSNYGDIREHKQTYLMLKAIELADPADKSTLRNYLGNKNLSANDADTVRSIVRRSGAQAACQQKVLELTSQAQDLIALLTVSEQSKQQFRELVSNVTERSF